METYRIKYIHTPTSRFQILSRAPASNPATQRGVLRWSPCIVVAVIRPIGSASYTPTSHAFHTRAYPLRSTPYTTNDLPTFNQGHFHEWPRRGPGVILDYDTRIPESCHSEWSDIHIAWSVPQGKDDGGLVLFGEGNGQVPMYHPHFLYPSFVGALR